MQCSVDVMTRCAVASPLSGTWSMRQAHGSENITLPGMRTQLTLRKISVSLLSRPS